MYQKGDRLVIHQQKQAPPLSLSLWKTEDKAALPILYPMRMVSGKSEYPETFLFPSANDQIVDDSGVPHNNYIIGIPIWGIFTHY